LCSLLVARVSISDIFGTKRGADLWVFPRLLRFPFLCLELGVGVDAGPGAEDAGDVDGAAFTLAVDCADVLIFYQF